MLWFRGGQLGNFGVLIRVSVQGVKSLGGHFACLEKSSKRAK